MGAETMGLSCRTRGTCPWDRSVRTLLFTAFLGFWIPRASGQVFAGIIDAKVGEKVTIQVPVTGNIFTYTWYRGGGGGAVGTDPVIITFQSPDTRIYGPGYTGRETGLLDGSLQISDVQTNYSGNYTRSLQLNGETAVTRIKQLNVYEPVSFPTIDPGPPSPIENGSLTLFCNASGTAVSYQWYREGTVVVSEGHITLRDNNQNLTLSPCSKSDTGSTFTCWASNAVSNRSSIPYIVNISYGPETTVISVSGGERFYAKGSPLTLSCSAESYPPALYTWLHNGTSTMGQNITINSLSLSDSGNYTCISTNNVTHISKNATREIVVLELVSKPFVSMNVSQPIENQPLALTCGNSSSATTILWSFNNSPLQPDNNRVTQSADNRMLTISRVSRSDAGVYRCEARNPVSSSVSDPLIVTVAYGPERPVITPSEKVKVKVGAELSLSCKAASYPAAQFQWLHNGTRVNNAQSTYTKASTTFEDSGSYTCLASNNVTGHSANVSAIVLISVNRPHCHYKICDDVIAGIVVAVVVLLIVAIVLIWYFVFKRPALAAQKGENSEMNGASLPSTANAPASGKANGPAEDVQYTTVKFAPKTDKVAMPAAPEGTVYSEVRRK